MKVKEVSVFKERKVNIGNYETVGLSVGLVIESTDPDKAYAEAEEWIDAKLQYFSDKWKNPRKITDAMAKENLAKRQETVPF